MEPEVTQLNRPGLHSHVCREACFLSYVYMNDSKWGGNIGGQNKMINVGRTGSEQGTNTVKCLMCTNENITKIHHFMKCNECMLMHLRERNEETSKRKKKKIR